MKEGLWSDSEVRRAIDHFSFVQCFEISGFEAVDENEPTFRGPSGTITEMDETLSVFRGPSRMVMHMGYESIYEEIYPENEEDEETDNLEEYDPKVEDQKKDDSPDQRGNKDAAEKNSEKDHKEAQALVAQEFPKSEKEDKHVVDCHYYQIRGLVRTGT